MIKDVNINFFNIPITRIKPTKFSRDKFYTLGVIKVTNEDNISGLADFVIRPNIKITKSIFDFIKKNIIGKSENHINKLINYLYVGGSWSLKNDNSYYESYILSALEIALYNLKTKKNNENIISYFGGNIIDRIDFSFALSNHSKKSILTDLKYARSKKIKNFLVKLGKNSNNINDDIEIFQFIIKNLKEDEEISIDANLSWSLSSCYKIFKIADQTNKVKYIESPIKGKKNLKNLKERFSIMICADEEIWSLKKIREYLEEDCVDVLALDIFTLGGVSKLKNAIDLTEIYNKNFLIHSHGEIITSNIAYSLALTSSIGSIIPHQYYFSSEEGNITACGNKFHQNNFKINNCKDFKLNSFSNYKTNKDINDLLKDINKYPLFPKY